MAELYILQPKYMNIHHTWKWNSWQPNHYCYVHWSSWFTWIHWLINSLANKEWTELYINLISRRIYFSKHAQLKSMKVPINPQKCWTTYCDVRIQDLISFEEESNLSKYTLLNGQNCLLLLCLMKFTPILVWFFRNNFGSHIYIYPQNREHNRHAGLMELLNVHNWPLYNDTHFFVKVLRFFAVSTSLVLTLGTLPISLKFRSTTCPRGVHDLGAILLK